MGKFKSLIAAVGVLALVAGCAKDQSADDYKNKVNADDFAKVQTANGVYTGKLISKSGVYWGALSLSLQAQEQTVSSTDTTKTSVQPILVAEIEFLGSSHIITSANTTSYDPTKGQFQADMKLPRGTSTVDVTISGTISGDGGFNGSMYVQGYSNYGGNFSLKRGGASVKSYSDKPAPNEVFSGMNYAGTTIFATGNVSKPVNLALLKPPADSNEDFLTLLTPVTPVIATLNFGNGETIEFSNAILDKTRNTVTGDADIPMTATASAGSTAGATASTGKLTLVCNANSQSGFDCNITTNQTAGSTAKLSTQPAPGNTSDVPDSGTRQPTEALYDGTAVYTGATASSKPATYAIKLLVTYDAKTRAQEILQYLFPQAEQTIHVSILLPMVSVNFPNSLWDVANGSLNGTQPLTVGAQSGTETLNCPAFSFVKTGSYDFACHYFSDINGRKGELHLKGTLP